MADQVTLDLSNIQPITQTANQPTQDSGGVKLDLSTLQPLTQQGSPDNKTVAPEEEKGFFGSALKTFGIEKQKVESHLSDVVKSALSFDMEKGLYSNTVDNLKKAKEAHDRGDYKVAGDAFTRAVPFIGNNIADSAAQFERGNVAGGAGTLTGTLSQIIAPELLKGAKRLAPEAPITNGINRLQSGIEGAAKGYERGASTPNPDVIAAGQRQGLELTPGQANKGAVRFNERLLRGSSETEAENYAAKDKAQIQQLKTNIGDIADSLLDGQNLPNGTTSEQAITHLAESARQRFGDVYGEEAARINELSGGIHSPLIENSNTLNAIKSLETKFAPSDNLAAVSPQRGALLQELSEARSMFDSELRAKNNAADMPTKNDVINSIRDTFRKLPDDTNDIIGARKVLRNAMKADLEQSLPPYLREAHSDMITNYAKGMDAIDSTIIQKILNKAEPEQIANAFSRNDFGANSIEEIRTALGSEKLNLVHNVFFKNIIEKASKKGALDGNAIDQVLEAANPQYLKTIPPDQLTRLRELAQDLKTLDIQAPKDLKNDLYKVPETPDISFSKGGILNLVLGKNSIIRVGAETVAKIARDPQGSVLLRKVIKNRGVGRAANLNKQRLMFLIHQQELRDGNNQ